MKLISDRIVRFGALLFLMALVLAGCATSSDPTFTSSPSIEKGSGAGSEGTNVFGKVDEVYRFKIGDLVVVTFAGGPIQLPDHRERIKEDGNITLDLIKDVKAEGKTAGELQTEILNRYVPKYYVRLTVTVTPPTQELFFHVSGEVRSPGPKLYLPDTTLTKAISSAGGLTEFARKGKVTITRSNGSKVTVDYNKAVENPERDLKVMPYDRIYVPRRAF